MAADTIAKNQQLTVLFELCIPSIFDALGLSSKWYFVRSQISSWCNSSFGSREIENEYMQLKYSI